MGDAGSSAIWSWRLSDLRAGWLGLDLNLSFTFWFALLYWAGGIRAGLYAMIVDHIGSLSILFRSVLYPRKNPRRLWPPPCITCFRPMSSPLPDWILRRLLRSLGVFCITPYNVYGASWDLEVFLHYSIQCLLLKLSKFLISLSRSWFKRRNW
jgi:hypothetical protein